MTSGNDSKRGRPKKSDSKRGYVKTRLSEDEAKMLDEMYSESDMSRSEIVRRAIRNAYLVHVNSQN